MQYRRLSARPLRLLSMQGRNTEVQDLEILLVLSVISIVWTIVIYNRLVRDRSRVLTAWSDIDVQLKRRYDLIPKLVEAVQQYADYESATLKAVVELRNAGEQISEIEDRGELETQLGSNLQRLIAVAEDYPELKASRSFLELQINLTEVEKNIQYARRYYNGCVRNLNIRIESFPDLLIASVFNFIKADFFEMSDS
jgi:LemA protein